MTEKEKKAIDILKKLSKPIHTEVVGSRWIKGYTTTVSTEVNEAIDIILNLIQKQDTEINKLNKEKEEWRIAYQEEKDKQFDILQENIKLKEVIDRMAEFIASGNSCINATPEQIKEDFIKEVRKNRITEERRGEYE